MIQSVEERKVIETTQENLFDDSINSSVALMITLFDSKNQLLSPYKIIEPNSSLERFGKP